MDFSLQTLPLLYIFKSCKKLKDLLSQKKPWMFLYKHNQTRFRTNCSQRQTFPFRSLVFSAPFWEAASWKVFCLLRTILDWLNWMSRSVGFYGPWWLRPHLERPVKPVKYSLYLPVNICTYFFFFSRFLSPFIFTSDFSMYSTIQLLL